MTGTKGDKPQREEYIWKTLHVFCKTLVLSSTLKRWAQQDHSGPGWCPVHMVSHQRSSPKHRGALSKEPTGLTTPVFQVWSCCSEMTEVTEASQCSLILLLCWLWSPRGKSAETSFLGASRFYCRNPLHPAPELIFCVFMEGVHPGVSVSVDNSLVAVLFAHLLSSLPCPSVKFKSMKALLYFVNRILYFEQICSLWYQLL